MDRKTSNNIVRQRAGPNNTAKKQLAQGQVTEKIHLPPSMMDLPCHIGGLTQLSRKIIYSQILVAMLYIIPWEQTRIKPMHKTMLSGCLQGNFKDVL